MIVLAMAFLAEAVLSNPEMVREGALWFSNLLVPDPLYIIPIVLGCMHLINNEVGQVTVKFLNFRTPENFAVIYLKGK